MPVNINSDLNGTVSHLPLNVIDVLALLDLQRAEAVPEVMPADLSFDFCRLERGFEMSINDVARVMGRLE